MTDSQIENELLAEQRGALGVLTLNRPQALNALTLDMIRGIATQLSAWEKDDAIRAVLIRGAGDKSFCAGGDIKAVYAVGMAYKNGDTARNETHDYFHQEYRMNRQIYHYPKPLIAFMDGITMGGGYGVAGPCRYRIATENTLFAMPEVAIGLFPDVGSTFFLNRSPHRIGYFLAVTGSRLRAADMIYAGLADYYCKSAQAEELEEALQADLAQGHDIAATLSALNTMPPGEAELAQRESMIERTFYKENIVEILTALVREKDPWALEMAQIIESSCPLSVKIALSHMLKSRGKSFDEVTETDFTLAQHFMDGTEFYEGVRALLIDKDKAPQWTPPRLDLLPDNEVERHFTPTGWSLDDGETA